MLEISESKIQFFSYAVRMTKAYGVLKSTWILPSPPQWVNTCDQSYDVLDIPLG